MTCPHGLMYSNLGPSATGTVQEAVEILGDGASVEEVGHCGADIEDL